jgi:hypothetical protein
MIKRVLTFHTIVLAILIAGFSQRAWANAIVNVTVNTSGLLAQPGSEVVFVLTDGSGANDANNLVMLTDVSLGGGTAGAIDALNTQGGATGDLGSGVTLTDSSFLNLFGQSFTAGTSLSFVLNLTTNVDAGGTPDQFALMLVDPSGTLLPSSDPFGSLLSVNLDSANPLFQNFNPDLVAVTPAETPAPVPEPASLLLLGSGLASMSAWRRRSRGRDTCSAS